MWKEEQQSLSEEAQSEYSQQGDKKIFLKQQNSSVMKKPLNLGQQNHSSDEQDRNLLQKKLKNLPSQNFLMGYKKISEQFLAQIDKHLRSFEDYFKDQDLQVQATKDFILNPQIFKTETKEKINESQTLPKILEEIIRGINIKLQNFKKDFEAISKSGNCKDYLKKSQQLMDDDALPRQFQLQGPKESFKKFSCFKFLSNQNGYQYLNGLEELPLKEVSLYLKLSCTTQDAKYAFGVSRYKNTNRKIEYKGDRFFLIDQGLQKFDYDAIKIKNEGVDQTMQAETEKLTQYYELKISIQMNFVRLTKLGTNHTTSIPLENSFASKLYLCFLIFDKDTMLELRQELFNDDNEDEDRGTRKKLKLE